MKGTRTSWHLRSGRRVEVLSLVRGVRSILSVQRGAITSLAFAATHISAGNACGPSGVARVFMSTCVPHMGVLVSFRIFKRSGWIIFSAPSWFFKILCVCLDRSCCSVDCMTCVLYLYVGFIGIYKCLMMLDGKSSQLVRTERVRVDDATNGTCQQSYLIPIRTTCGPGCQEALDVPNSYA